MICWLNIKFISPDPAKLAFFLPILFCFSSAVSGADESGFNAFKRTLNTRDYALSRVAAPAPVRAGRISQRFEIRDGDCESKAGGWDDCRSDRERIELTAANDFFAGEEKWIAWSVFIPFDFVDIFPAKTTLAQIHQEGGPQGIQNGLPTAPPLLQFELLDGSYALCHHRVEVRGERIQDDTDVVPLIPLARMRGQWTDIVLHIKFAKKGGFAIVYVNGEEKAKINENLILQPASFYYFKYGIYNAFVSRYRANHRKLPTQIVYFDEVRLGSKREEVDLHFNPQLKAVD